MILTEILPLEYRAPTDTHIARLQAQQARDTDRRNAEGSRRWHVESFGSQRGVILSTVGDMPIDGIGGS